MSLLLQHHNVCYRVESGHSAPNLSPALRPRFPDTTRTGVFPNCRCRSIQRPKFRPRPSPSWASPNANIKALTLKPRLEIGVSYDYLVQVQPRFEVPVFNEAASIDFKLVSHLRRLATLKSASYTLYGDRRERLGLTICDSRSGSQPAILALHRHHLAQDH